MQDTGEESDESPGKSVNIDAEKVEAVGPLAYATLEKERARRHFKALRRGEHLANGNFARVARRKKGDVRLSARERHSRRLGMNRDSAAAARYSEGVFVETLQTLVGWRCAENAEFAKEVAEMRDLCTFMKEKLHDLRVKVARKGGARRLACVGRRAGAGSKGDRVLAGFAGFLEGAQASIGEGIAQLEFRPARAV